MTRTMRTKWVFLMVVALLAGGCSFASLPEADTGKGEKAVAQSAVKEEYRTPGGERGFVYYPKSPDKDRNRKYPLVLMMCGTNQDPVHDAEGTGWVDLAGKEDLILLVPVYNDYATYSNVDTLLSVLDYAEDKYPVDRTRVYSTGFSNGGAMSVALASTHPERLAAISAYGWMVDMQGEGKLAASYDMPFQVIQGTEEYTGKDDEGHPVIMQDEQEAIRSLLLFDEMISPEAQPDYAAVPWWGWAPDSSRQEILQGRTVTINDCAKNGYRHPFAQMVLIDGETHRVHPYDASLAWNFMKPYSRKPDGTLIETP